MHTVISPTSFRAEYRRAGSGSSLLARPVKLQVDMVRATGGISTGGVNAANLNNPIPSEREVYAVNFQLLSGPTRRFKRLCDQLQTALLAGPTHPTFVSASSGNGTTTTTAVKPGLIQDPLVNTGSTGACLPQASSGRTVGVDSQDALVCSNCCMHALCAGLLRSKLTIILKTLFVSENHGMDKSAFIFTLTQMKRY